MKENVDSIEPAPLDRSLWSKAQRQVFEDALDGHQLIDIVNGWTAPTEDATDPSRKILHVPPLATAAASLIMSDVIQLVREEEPTVPLSKDRALAIVADPENWWPPEPIEDDANRPQHENLPDSYIGYSLVSTAFGESLPIPGP